MSFRDYLHEKAEESRHNETTAYLMFLAGALFFVSGILITLALPGSPGWFLFIPYYGDTHPGAILGLAMTICGLTLTVFGIGAGIHYSHDRGWYMHTIYKSYSTSNPDDIHTRQKTERTNNRNNKRNDVHFQPPKRNNRHKQSSGTQRVPDEQQSEEQQ